MAMLIIDIVAKKNNNTKQLEDPNPVTIAIEGFLEVQV